MHFNKHKLCNRHFLFKLWVMISCQWPKNSGLISCPSMSLLFLVIYFPIFFLGGGIEFVKFLSIFKYLEELLINEHSCNKFVLLLYNLSGKIIHEKFSDFMQIDVVMYVEVQSSSPSLSYIPLSLTSLSANLPLILYLPLPFCIFPFPYLLYLPTFH